MRSAKTSAPSIAARRCGLLVLLCLLTPVAAQQAPPAQNEAKTDLGAFTERVHALLAEDRWRQALDVAEGACGDQPGDPRCASLLGQASFRAGRFEEVERLLAPIVDDPQAPPRALLTLARLRNAQGRGRESAALGQRAVEAAPEDRLLLYWAADVAPTRQRTVELLDRYLERSEGDNADRIEDAEGTLRVLKELGDRRVWIPLQRPERLELPLRHIWDEAGDTVGYVLIASIGERGKPAKLLFDTGNHGLYVIERIASKRGFTSLGEATTFGGAGSRKHRVERGLFPVFALGDLRYADALVTSTHEEVEATGRFHGLLGLSALAGYRVTLDLRKKRILLEPATEPLEGQPYWVIAGQILVRAAAEGGEPGLFLFDTGAMRSLLSQAHVEGIEGVTFGTATAVQGLGGMYEGARAVHGTRLAFQGLNGRRNPTAVDTSARSRMTGVEISGYLGLDVLARARIIIDTRHQTIRVEH
jgi:tetratricopeptide (TPR) repeat protein